ncbi:MAG: RDD family protein [Actinobacteria bacterium]|nr:RDD family protein [Actinomycetota bacterium]
MDLTLAGLGSRVIAYVIDYAIIMVAIILVYAAMLLVELSVLHSSTGIVGDIFSAFAVVFIFASYFGYFVLFEVFDRGRSPGKRLVGLRVVRSDGGAVSFRGSLLRNLLRIVDSFPPPTYLVGLVLVFATSHHQRLGDMASGTLVVRERIGDRPRVGAGFVPAVFPAGVATLPPYRGVPAVVPALPFSYGGMTFVVPSVVPGAPGMAWGGTPPPPRAPQGWDLTGLQIEELRLVEEFLHRRWSLSMQARVSLAEGLAERVRTKVVAPGAPPDAEGFLEAVAYVKLTTI